MTAILFLIGVLALAGLIIIIGGLTAVGLRWLTAVGLRWLLGAFKKEAKPEFPSDEINAKKGGSDHDDSA